MPAWHSDQHLNGKGHTGMLSMSLRAALENLVVEAQ